MKINLNPNPSPLADGDSDAKIAEGGFGKYYTTIWLFLSGAKIPDGARPN